MINKSNEAILQEIERFKPEVVKEYKQLSPNFDEEFGTVNIDISLLDLGSDTKCSFALIRDDLVETVVRGYEDISSMLCEDICMNHRYPNHRYFTLSKKSGRKICKTGYPVIGPIGLLNSFKQLAVQIRIKEETMTFIFPISFVLSAEKPICGLKILMHNKGMLIETYKPGYSFLPGLSRRVWSATAYRYYGGEPLYGDEVEDIELIPFTGDFSDNTVVFRTKIQMFAQSFREHVFL